MNHSVWHKIGHMQANYVQRLRLTFRKFGPTRYIGHLDLARTLERSLNRAKIPLARTQGFNPRPRMQFASALSLGYTSDQELADIWLMELLEPAETQAAMMARMAPGLEITAVSDIPLQAPPLQTIIHAARYAATPLDPLDADDLQRRVDELLAAESMMRERKRKKGKVRRYDLRPLIYELSLDQTAQAPTLHFLLALEEGKTGRPDELLLQLGFDPLEVRVHRAEIMLKETF